MALALRGALSEVPPPSHRHPVFELPAVASTLSCLGCLCVLWRLWRLRGRRRRVFDLHLISLFLADLLQHGGAAVLYFARSPFGLDGGAFCTGSLSFYYGVLFTSFLQELLLATYLAVQLFRWTKVLSASRFLILPIWVLGCALGALAGHSEGWHFVDGFCHAERSSVRRIMYLAPLGGNILLYALMLHRAFRNSAPGSQAERALRRAGIYLLSFAMSYSLTLVWFWTPLRLPPMLQILADTTQSCAGFFNALAYASQGRYATLSPWLPSRRSEGADLKASFRVEVGGAKFIEYSSEASTIAGSATVLESNDEGGTNS